MHLPANLKKADLYAGPCHGPQDQDRTDEVENSRCDEAVEHIKGHETSPFRCEAKALMLTDGNLFTLQLDDLSATNLATFA